MSDTGDTTMRYLFLFFIIVGCGLEQACQSTGYDRRRTVIPIGECSTDQLSFKIHPKLEYAVELFSKDALKYNVPCQRTGRIGFALTLPKDVSPSTVGYCTPPYEVRMLATFWESASASERLALMYHELGHCALGLEHYEGKPDIMNSYILDSATAEKKWDSLVHNMFERAKQ